MSTVLETLTILTHRYNFYYLYPSRPIYKKFHFQVSVKISDVKLHLTQVQYGLLFKLSQSVPRIFAGVPDGSVQQQEPDAPPSSDSSEHLQPVVDLNPELRIISPNNSQNWTTLDLIVTVNVVKLHLYDALATGEENLKDHGIARFALNSNTLRFKMVSDGSGEAQVVLKSFTMSNTRPGNSKFREIIPAAQHDRNQFMILYTMSGNGSALAILTIDSPRIIFAVDPIIALLDFFTSAFSTRPDPNGGVDAETKQTEANPSALDFRIDLHEVSVSVLENDADPDSQAIKLSINQILLSQQVGALKLVFLCFLTR